MDYCHYVAQRQSIEEVLVLDFGEVEDWVIVYGRLIQYHQFVLRNHVPGGIAHPHFMR